jgi:hypothetical protein
MPITDAEHLYEAVRTYAWAGENERIREIVSTHAVLVSELEPQRGHRVGHMTAVAAARLGHRDAAISTWRELGVGSSILVRDNLLAVEADEATQPWYFTIYELTPSAVNLMIDERNVTHAQGATRARSEYPNILEILPQFEALGGPSAVRFADICLGRDDGREGPGAEPEPESIIIGGYTVYTEPVESAPDAVADPAREALKCLTDGKPEKAEGILRAAIAKEPDYPTLHQNLAAALERQGRTEESLQCIHDLHARFPDYLFARCAVAMNVATQGDPEEARALIAPVLKRDSMHFMEFGSLCRAMCAIATAEKDWAEVGRWVEFWRTSDPGSSDPDSFELRANLGQGFARIQQLSNSSSKTTPRRRRKSKKRHDDPRQGELF